MCTFGAKTYFLTSNFLIMKHLDFFKRCGSTRLWCLLALVALTANVAKAELIFHESFDKAEGQLSVGRSANCNDSTKWWTLSGWYADSEPSNPIQVVEGSLSYAGYVTTATGNKAKLKTVSGTKDVRRFKDVTTGSIYIAAIINVESATTSSDYFFGVCDGSSNYYGKVYAMSVEGGYKLAIAKNTETKTDLTYTSTTLNYKTNYLIVEEYVIRDGVKNDSVNLWINPTKSKTVPTLICDMSKANAKADPSKIAGVYLIQTTNAPTVAIDEIKVATAWDDLFESGSTPEPSTTPTIKSSTAKLEFGELYVDGIQTLKFTVTGTDLTGDIALASNNEEVVLDKATIAKTDAEADGGVEVTATLTAATAGAQTATITLSSEGATNVTIAVSWTATAVTKVATIAALKAGATTPKALFLYTGEAVITYYEVTGTYNTPTFYVEDATGAVCIYDYAKNTCKVGDKIKNFKVVASSEETYRGLPFSFVSTVTVVSSSNEWTPQVVTLKQLQDNAADYLMELVKVENVTLDRTESNYEAGNNAISQDGTGAVINLTSDNTLVGTAKPATADIVGISYFTSGYNIRVRTANDIVAKTTPTGLCRPAEAGQPLCYAADGLLHIEGAAGEVAIYNLTGLCVVKTTVAEQATIALPQGVYAVKVAGNTHKVVVSSK